MENVVAIGVVISRNLSLKPTEKALGKSVDSLRRGCMLKITKVGSRCHMACHNGHTVYAKADCLDLIFKSLYSHADFQNDLTRILNFKEPQFMLENTVTLSAFRNPGHRLITPVERYLKTLGYYAGQIEDDNGEPPAYGQELEAAVKDYQRFYMQLSPDKQDGILTAHGPVWKSLIESPLY